MNLLEVKMKYMRVIASTYLVIQNKIATKSRFKQVFLW